MSLPKTQLTIKRSEWGQGTLYSTTKKCFCIMGFFLNQVCKVPKEGLADKGYSNHVKEFDHSGEYGKVLSKTGADSILAFKDLQQVIINMNDKGGLGVTKQRNLKAIFKKHLNCTLKFKD